jgi:hypothetical protein
MTSDHRRLIYSLVTVPGGPSPISHEEFLRRFGASDGSTLGLQLLRDATERKDGDGVELALIVCFAFGFTSDHLKFLVELAFADWHVKHEDVVTALSQLRDPDTVNALHHATQWVPPYLAFDENRALARKAIRALGGIPGDRARHALLRAFESGGAVVRKYAEKELCRILGEG